MKTIIVPTDLSAETDNALSVAVDVARVYQSTILLLHSVVYPVAVPAYAEATTLLVNQTIADYIAIEREAKSALEKLAANSKYKDVKIIPTLLTNGQGLTHNITDRAADLIVMTSAGASGLEEWLVGSNAETVVRNAHCPVLIIKEPVAHFHPKNIIYAIDVDDRLKAVQHYFFQMGERDHYQFLYVKTPTDSRVTEGIRDWVNEFAAGKGITDFTCTIRTARDVPDGIINYADEVEADLIVLFTHGYKGIQHFLLGSVAEDVLNHTTKPVLVLHM
ncbi:universal stress protein [Spirosoma koreense]